MSKKNRNKNSNVDKLIKSDITVQKSNKKIVISLIIIIVLLLFAICYLIFFKKNDCPVCEETKIVEVEIEPTYQYINYEGFKFKMPLSWDFVKDSNKYEITNEEESIFVNLYSVDVSYEEFSSVDYQKSYLEEIQTASNTKINKSKEYTKDDINYYLFEGTYNDYNFQIIAVGTSKKVVLVNVQYVNKLAYKDLKDSVLDFALSALSIVQE